MSDNNSRRTFYVDRSRMDAYQRCPQARYLGYHLEGTGVRTSYINLDIVIGIAVHEGLGELLTRHIGLDNLSTSYDRDVDSAVIQGLVRLEKELISSPFNPNEFIFEEETESAIPGLVLPGVSESTNLSPDSKILYTIEETRALVEMLIRAYAYAPAGMRWLISEYEILESEQEDNFTLAENNSFTVEFMARADGVLRRRIGNDLVVLSFKTTKKMDSRKEVSAASDMQGMSEVVAIENRLSEWSKAIDNLYAISKQENIPPPTKDQINNLFGIPAWFVTSQPTTIEGVQMIYLLTSDNYQYKSALKQRTSGILRPWVMRSPVGDNYAFTSKWQDSEGKNRSLGKDWTRVNSWELDGGVREYIELIKDSYDDALNANPLDTVIVNPGLHRREPDKLVRWQQEITAQETRLAGALTEMEIFAQAGESNAHLLPIYFPHHSSSCAYPTKCQYFNICWGTRFEAENPLGSGYKRRVPHHELERKEFEDNG